MEAQEGYKRVSSWRDGWRLLKVCLWLSCVGYWIELFVVAGFWLLDITGVRGIGPGFFGGFCVALWFFGSYIPARIGYYVAGLLVFVVSLVAAVAGRRRDFIFPLAVLSVSAVAAIAAGIALVQMGTSLPISLSGHFWPWFKQ